MKIVAWVIGLVISFTATPAFAQWAAPTSTPPGGNTATPINVGTTAQVKNGGLSVNAFSAFANSYFSSSVGIGTTSPSAKFSVTGSGTGTGRAFVVANSSNSEKVTVLDNGNVGVGIGSPVQKLHVSGNIRTDGTIFANDGTANGGVFGLGTASNTVLSGNSAGTLLTLNGAGYTDVSINGNTGIGTTTPNQKLSVIGNVLFGNSADSTIFAAIGYNLFAENGYSLYTLGSGPLTFGTASQRRMTITSAGNVGIGNTIPTSALTVGDDIGVGSSKAVAFGNTSGNFYQYTGQDSTHNLAMGWTYNATAASAFAIIQTFSRSNPLYVDGSQLYLNTQSSAGNVGVGTTLPGYKLEVNGAVGAVSFFYTSDKSLKKNIKPLTSSLDKITKLQGVSFDWKKDSKPSVGLIAQDVEKVYPELVNTNSASGIKSVEYGNLVAPLIEAVKEQQKQIDDQGKFIERQQKQIDELKTIIESR